MLHFSFPLKKRKMFNHSHLPDHFSQNESSFPALFTVKKNDLFMPIQKTNQRLGRSFLCYRYRSIQVVVKTFQKNCIPAPLHFFDNSRFLANFKINSDWTAENKVSLAVTNTS